MKLRNQSSTLLMEKPNKILKIRIKMEKRKIKRKNRKIILLKSIKFIKESVKEKIILASTKNWTLYQRNKTSKTKYQTIIILKVYH